MSNMGIIVHSHATRMVLFPELCNCCSDITVFMCFEEKNKEMHLNNTWTPLFNICIIMTSKEIGSDVTGI